MTYQEQLQTKEWRLKRLRIILRDNFRCCLCDWGNRERFNRLHVHHTLYIKGKMAWEYEDEDLLTLCSSCHTKMHYNKVIEAQIDKLLIKNIINNNLIDILT